MAIAGTPKQVIAKTCIRLREEDVFPAVREMAKQFDLRCPFETNQPVKTQCMPGPRVAAG